MVNLLYVYATFIYGWIWIIFQLLPVVNMLLWTWMNTYLCKNVLRIFFSYVFRSRVPGLHINSIFNFWRTVKSLIKWHHLAPTIIPVFCLLHSLTNLERLLFLCSVYICVDICYVYVCVCPWIRVQTVVSCLTEDLIYFLNKHLLVDDDLQVSPILCCFFF